MRVNRLFLFWSIKCKRKMLALNAIKESIFFYFFFRGNRRLLPFEYTLGKESIIECTGDCGKENCRYDLKKVSKKKIPSLQPLAFSGLASTRLGCLAGCIILVIFLSCVTGRVYGESKLIWFTFQLHGPHFMLV